MFNVCHTDAEVAAASLVESLLRLYWWNGVLWVACSDTGADAVAEYIWVRITDTTIPNVSQLVGSLFGSSWND